jgi:tetratricopeptide (TPR) repeat protein
MENDAESSLARLNLRVVHHLPFFMYPIRAAFRFAPLAIGLVLQVDAVCAEAEQPSAKPDDKGGASVEHARELMKHLQFKDAEKELEKIVLFDQQTRGPQDPQTLADRLDYAVAQGKAGDTISAENELRSLLPIFTRRYGAEQGETLRCRIGLARLLDEVGRPHEAVEIYQDVLQIRERVLGPDHLDVARVQHFLADSLVATRNYPGAIEQYRKAGFVFEKSLGAENTETLLNRSNLAMAKNSHREFDAAEKDLKDILAIRERLLGPDDTTVLATCYFMAEVLRNEKKYAEALTYGTRSLEGWRRTLGDSNGLFHKADRLCVEIRQDLADAGQ